MLNDTSPLLWIKHNPVLSALVMIIALLPQTVTQAQTFTWTNNDGDNVWINDDNWFGSSAPNSTSQIARILGGSGTTIFLRGGTSGTNNIGTISIENELYQRLYAGAPAATVNFASSAAFLYQPDTDHPAQFFIGDADGTLSTSSLKTTFVVPGTLAVNGAHTSLVANASFAQINFGTVSSAVTFQLGNTNAGTLTLGGNGQPIVCIIGVTTH
jgi:hypothetical protein